MSIIGIGLNLLLAVLLAATLMMGWRLNRRLKALRDSHAGFAVAVRDLNIAAERAEQGLADLRAATDEATDDLSDRIEKGRALAVKLEKLLREEPAPRVRAPEAPQRAEVSLRMRAAEPAPAPRQPALDDIAVERRLGALLSAAREARLRPEEEPLELRQPIAARPSPRARMIAIEDDDLFEDLPAPAPLKTVAGGRR